MATTVVACALLSTTLTSAAGLEAPVDPSTAAAGVGVRTPAGGEQPTGGAGYHHLRADDLAVVSCQNQPDCAVWAAHLIRADAELDGILTPTRLMAPRLRVIIPAPDTQERLVGARVGGAPAATTTYPTQRHLAEGLATPDQLGEMWLVLNPALTQRSEAEILPLMVHELVHVRTRAPHTPAPLWVEEGYAVAVTERVLGARSRSPLAPHSVPIEGDLAAQWPTDEWRPQTWQDYEEAGGLVQRLAGEYGWDQVDRWYGRVTAGAPPAGILQQ